MRDFIKSPDILHDWHQDYAGTIHSFSRLHDQGDGGLANRRGTASLKESIAIFTE